MPPKTTYKRVKFVLPSISGRPCQYLWNRKWTCFYRGMFLGLVWLEYRKHYKLKPNKG